MGIPMSELKKELIVILANRLRKFQTTFHYLFIIIFYLTVFFYVSTAVVAITAISTGSKGVWGIAGISLVLSIGLTYFRKRDFFDIVDTKALAIVNETFKNDKRFSENFSDPMEAFRCATIYLNGRRVDRRRHR